MIDIFVALGTTTGLAGALLCVISIFALLITRGRNPYVTVLSILVLAVGALCLLQSLEVINITWPFKPATTTSP